MPQVVTASGNSARRSLVGVSSRYQVSCVLAFASVSPALVWSSSATSTPPVASSTTVVTSVGISENPDIEPGCGIDVVLLLDASGSIEEADATDAVVLAAQTYLSSLSGTSSRVGVVSFHSTASVAVGYEPVTAQSVAATGPHWAAIDGPAPGSYRSMATASSFRGTNWEAGLAAVSSLGPPDLVVFVTDGVPTMWLDDVGSPILAPETVEGVLAAADQAAPLADGLKAAGSHLLIVAVGTILEFVTPENYRRAPPGPLTVLTQLVEPAARRLGFFYPPSSGLDATFEPTSDDVVLVQDFAALTQRLVEVATSQCPAASSVVPTTTEAPATNDELAPTGSRTSNLVAISLVTLAAGTAVWFAGRRTGSTRSKRQGAGDR